MKRLTVIAFACGLVLALASPARADHIPTNVGVLPAGIPAGAPVIGEGPIRFIANATAGQGVAAPLGELPPFKRAGRTYLIASDSIYGLRVLDVTDVMKPVVISSYSSSFGCPTAEPETQTFDALGLVGWENDISVTPDGRIAAIGMDAAGRCHDPEGGGVELVDLSDLTNPRTLALTRDVGDAHSITIDPVHPWLAYTSTSDGADFIDIIDFKSCLGGIAKLEACKPIVARTNFDKATFPNVPMEGNNDVISSGCHDLRVRGDRIYCAAVNTTFILDISHLLDAEGELTGTHLTDQPNACPVVDAKRAAGVKVTNCYDWSESNWAAAKAKSADMRLVSIIIHDGNKPPNEDIEIAHQADITADGKMMWITDERGGGLINFDGCPGGGIWFYDIRDERHPKLMHTPTGDPAVYITETNLPGTAHMSCTAHYGDQFGKENVMAFGWYLNGMRVMKFETDYSKSPATIEFDEIGAYLCAGCYTIQAKPMAVNPNDPKELIVYAANATSGVDVLGIKIPSLGLSSKVHVKTHVLGNKTRAKPLARTGLGDPASVAVILVALAAFISRRLRAVW